MIIAAKFPNYLTGAFFFLLHFASLSWEQNILTCRSVTLGVNSKQGFPGLIYYAPDPEQKIGGEGHIGQAELLQWQEKCKLQIRSELCWGGDQLSSQSCSLFGFDCSLLITFLLLQLTWPDGEGLRSLISIFWDIGCIFRLIVHKAMSYFVGYLCLDRLYYRSGVSDTRWVARALAAGVRVKNAPT